MRFLGLIGSRWRRLPRWARIALLSTFAPLLSVVFLWFSLSLAAWLQLRYEYARAQEQGEPTTLEALAPSPVPDDENAAPLLLKACVGMRSGFSVRNPPGTQTVARDWALPFLCPGPSLDVPPQAGLKKAVELFSDVLGSLHAAAARPHCRPPDWPRFRGTFCFVERIPMLLTAEALVHANAGNKAEAAESLSCLFKIARVLTDEPRLQESAWMITRDALWILQGIVRRTRLPDVALQEGVSRMQAIDFHSMVTTKLIAERADILTRIDRWHRGTLGWEGYETRMPDPRRRWIAPFMWYRDEARLVAMLTDMVDVSRLPPWEAMPKLVSLSERDRGKPLWRCPMGWYFYRGYVPLEIYRTWALRDAAILGLSCELFRSGRGRYPATLDELAPEFLKEIPPDPFTGKPFSLSTPRRRPRVHRLLGRREPEG